MCCFDCAHSPLPESNGPSCSSWQSMCNIATHKQPTHVQQCFGDNQTHTNTLALHSLQELTCDWSLLLLFREALAAVVGPGAGQPGLQSALEDELSPESSHNSFDQTADNATGEFSPSQQLYGGTNLVGEGLMQHCSSHAKPSWAKCKSVRGRCIRLWLTCLCLKQWSTHTEPYGRP